MVSCVVVSCAHAHPVRRHAHYVHTMCTLCAHYVHTMCTLCAHYTHTTRTLCAHPVRGHVVGEIVQLAHTRLHLGGK